MCHYYPGDKAGWEITSALLEITSAQPGIPATFGRMGVIRERGKSSPKIKTQEFGFLAFCIFYIFGGRVFCFDFLGFFCLFGDFYFCFLVFSFVCLFYFLFVCSCFGFFWGGLLLVFWGFLKFAFKLLYLESAA